MWPSPEVGYRVWTSAAKRRRVPLLGGVPSYLAVGMAGYVFHLSDLKIVLLAGLPLILTGAVDDVRELKAKQKLAGQLLAVALWFYVIPSESLLLSKLGVWEPLAIGISAFWMLGIINALNMIDGMDSEAAGFSMIVCGFFVLLFGLSGPGLSSLAVMGGCMGFLFFNWPPARIYLGDSGSTFLGFFSGRNGGDTAYSSCDPCLAFPFGAIVSFGLTGNGRSVVNSQKDSQSHVSNEG